MTLKTVAIVRCLDSTRAERLFGFKARVGFDEGLQQTIEWCRQHRTADAALKKRMGGEPIGLRAAM